MGSERLQNNSTMCFIVECLKTINENILLQEYVIDWKIHNVKLKIYYFQYNI